MNINTQYKIKGSLNNLRYLREKSYWYKYLNRSYEYLKYFEDEMKKTYKLTPEDRMKKMADGINSLSKIMDILS